MRWRQRIWPACCCPRPSTADGRARRGACNRRVAPSPTGTYRRVRARAHTPRSTAPPRPHPVTSSRYKKLTRRPGRCVAAASLDSPRSESQASRRQHPYGHRRHWDSLRRRCDLRPWRLPGRHRRWHQPWGLRCRGRKWTRRAQGCPACARPPHLGLRRHRRTGRRRWHRRISHSRIPRRTRRRRSLGNRPAADNSTALRLIGRRNARRRLHDREAAPAPRGTAAAAESRAQRTGRGAGRRCLQRPSAKATAVGRRGARLECPWCCRRRMPLRCPTGSRTAGSRVPASTSRSGYPAGGRQQAAAAMATRSQGAQTRCRAPCC
jgi:hypothetical protein